MARTPQGLLDPYLKTAREPARDARAQVKAVANPASAKRSAFFAPGTKVPKVPAGLQKVKRPEGTLITNSPRHAAAFAAPAALNEAHLAPLLGYPESKRQAMASGAPHVVQGRSPAGAVVHESLASPGRMGAALGAASAAVPGGSVVITSPAAALARRKR